MSEISEEDSIKISVNVPRLSEGVSKIPRYLSFQCVLPKKRYSLPGFWLEIRIIGSDSPVVENQTARFSKVGLSPHLKNHTLGFKS